jgi:hypothetical protein
MCVLCRDTFSRSDILKRHFQKCSIRRGNPTGASHLSHAQAHLKKNQPAHKANNSMSNPNDLMGMNSMPNMGNGIHNGLQGMNNGMNNGMNSLTNESTLPFGVDPNGNIPDTGSNMTDEQAEQLQRNELSKRLSAVDGRDRRSMTGPSPGGSNQASFDQQSYAGAMASTMPPGMNPSLAYNLPNGQNGHSYNMPLTATATAMCNHHPPLVRSMECGHRCTTQPHTKITRTISIRLSTTLKYLLRPNFPIPQILPLTACFQQIQITTILKYL